MHYRLLLCADCDLLYASPVPEKRVVDRRVPGGGLRQLAARRAVAARTYARAAAANRSPRLPDRSGALDIGAGDGAFLKELLANGLQRRGRRRTVRRAHRGGRGGDPAAVRQAPSASRIFRDDSSV